MACDSTIMAPELLGEDGCKSEEKTPHSQEAYLDMVISSGYSLVEESIEVANNESDHTTVSCVKESPSCPVEGLSYKNTTSAPSSNVINAINDAHLNGDGITSLKENVLDNKTKRPVCRVSNGLEEREQGFKAPMDLRCSKNFVKDACDYMFGIWVTDHDAGCDGSKGRRGVYEDYNSAKSKQGLLSLLEKYVGVEGNEIHGSEEICPLEDGEVCLLEGRKVSCGSMSEGIDISQKYSMVNSEIHCSNSSEGEYCSVEGFKRVSVERFEKGCLGLNDIMEEEFVDDDCPYDVGTTRDSWIKIDDAYIESFKFLIDLDNYIGHREDESLIGINVWRKYGRGLLDSAELELFCSEEQELFSLEIDSLARLIAANTTPGSVSGEVESILCVD